MALRPLNTGSLSAWLILASAAMAVCGCQTLVPTSDEPLSIQTAPEVKIEGTAGDFARTSLESEQPDLGPDETSRWYYSGHRQLLPVEKRQPWSLTLEQTTRMALSTSKVIRELGGAVVDTPQRVTTIFDPAIVETDPFWGTSAALSLFDAEFGTRLYFNSRERTLKNNIEGNGTRNPRFVSAIQDLTLSKTTATGTRFSFGSGTNYDRDNSPVNLFDGSHTAGLRGEVRQPIQQGAGLSFNRIAGPAAVPGVYRGIMVARLRADIRVADFQAAVRNFLFEVERAYWELYFAYRDLDARIESRDQNLEIWRAVQARFENGMAEGDDEALARERFYAASVEVDNALRGRPVGTAMRSKTHIGIHGWNGGLIAAERRLRYLIGLPVYDGKLIRPVDEPVRAKVVFDRAGSLQQAFHRRLELRRQSLKVRRRELELIAAKNFLKPKVDLIGLYRLHGFGDNLFGPGGGGVSSGAYGGLFDGDLQDWAVGLEWTAPIGFRRSHSSVRNAELRVVRERAILREQEHQIAHELDASFSELDRAHAVSRANFNRRVAARERAAAVWLKYQGGRLDLEFVSEAHRRSAAAESDLARSLVDHVMALASIHYSRGTYLDFLGVHLTESPRSFGRNGDGADAPSGPLNYVMSSRPEETADEPMRTDELPANKKAKPATLGEPQPVEPLPIPKTDGNDNELN